MANGKEEDLTFEHHVMSASRGRAALSATPDRSFQFLGPKYASKGRDGALRLPNDTRPDVLYSGKPECTKVESGLTNTNE